MSTNKLRITLPRLPLLPHPLASDPQRFDVCAHIMVAGTTDTEQLDRMIAVVEEVGRFFGWSVGDDFVLWTVDDVDRHGAQAGQVVFAARCRHRDGAGKNIAVTGGEEPRPPAAHAKPCDQDSRPVDGMLGDDVLQKGEDGLFRSLVAPSTGRHVGRHDDCPPLPKGWFNDSSHEAGSVVWRAPAWMEGEHQWSRVVGALVVAGRERDAVGHHEAVGQLEDRIGHGGSRG